MDNDDDSDPLDYGGGGEDYSEERSESSDEDDEDLTFDEIVRRIEENDPDTTELRGSGYVERVQNMTDEEWEELGRDIANNTHLEELRLFEGALNDHKMSFFFRGLTRSNTIKNVFLDENGLSIAGVRSMVPFLHNANNSVRYLDLDHNNIQSEGPNRDDALQWMWH